MSYDFFLGRMLFPIPPPKLQLKVRNQNKTINLVSGEEVNLVKPIGLRTYSFTVLLPNTPYPFASYPDGFEPAIHYLDQLREMKVEKKPVQFIISRFTPDNKPIFDTNIRVSLEGYSVTEDATKGIGDIYVDVELKECPYYGTKTGVINEDGTAIVVSTRNNDSAPRAPSYTVQIGDSLWEISKRLLGNGERFGEIYLLNRAVIDKSNADVGGSKYSISVGMVLEIPT